MKDKMTIPLYFYKVSNNIWPSDLEEAGIYEKEIAGICVYEGETDKELYSFIVFQNKIPDEYIGKLIYKNNYDYRPFSFKNQYCFKLEYEHIFRTVVYMPDPITDGATGKRIYYCIVYNNLDNITDDGLIDSLRSQMKILKLWN
jgi:hypothetical protein